MFNFSQITDFFVPIMIDKNNLLLNRKAKILINICMACIVLALFLKSIVLLEISYTDLPFAGVSLCLFFILLIFKQTGSFFICGNLMCFTAALGLGRQALKTGGVASPDYISLIIIPLFAFLVIGKRSGFWWGVVIFIYGCVLYSLGIQGLIPNMKSVPLGLDFYLIAQIGVMICVVSITYLAHEGQQMLITALEEKNKTLEAQQITIAEQKEQLRQAKELERVKAALLESNKSLQSFASAVSHDLKQPLINIQSFSEILKDCLKKEEHLDGMIKESLEYILQNTQSMLQLIQDLLKYARFSQEGNFQLEMTDVNKVIEQIEKYLHLQIKEANATIETQDLPIIQSAPSLLTQVFQNLICNAIKFRKKETKLHITIKVVEQENDYLFSVTDNGIGIEKIFSEKIFQPFKKLHSKYEYPGSGIGLSNCEKIINKHEGKIWVESELGKGTTFYFTITKKPFTYDIFEKPAIEPSLPVLPSIESKSAVVV